MAYSLPYGLPHGYTVPLPHHTHPCPPHHMATCTMRLQGVGIIEAKPDTATVILGAVTENENLQMAQAENSQRIDGIIQALIGLGISREDIETLSYSVEPQYDYREGTQVFRAYRVTYDLKITIENLEATGRIIDTAVAQGANMVRNIDFSIQDTSPIYRQALILAIQDAQKKAEAVEESLGIVIHKTPISISEIDYSFQPLPVRDYLRMPEGAIPIQPGQIEITAKVEVLFSYRCF